ncbi:MAG: CDP-diacylglycerol--glycerol-3-phosphate 3-phosphatidyltransferase [Phycisphaera sp.]|nr:CDP-diacylglycerol--glycerol-3-phosphate 3-phosphatidyltransferase [Phycisphaera sp.]
MYRHIPNQLTLARLVLAGVFFVVLNVYRYGELPGKGEAWAIWLAIVIFILASITDFLDGYLARKWKVESTFGRIMDPFCDKVLVLGAFIYLAGPRFVDPRAVEAGSFFNMASGVYPWMVALMLARELLVTCVRGELEGKGVAFGAKIWGKLKTTLQVIAIPVILLIVELDPHAPDHGWMVYVRDTLVYAIVMVTLASGVPYITSAARAMRQDKPRQS